MYEAPPEDKWFTPAQLTKLSWPEIAYFLSKAFLELESKKISQNSLAILWAQVCLETAHGGKIFNNNFGNIKKLKDHSYTSYDCSEILNGKNENFKPYHPQTFFAAWPTALDGAKGYLYFLKTKKNYKEAWQMMLLGDPVKYVEALKKGGYFTANLASYTKVVVNLTKTFHKNYESFMTYEPPTIVEPKEKLPESETKQPPESIGSNKEQDKEATVIKDKVKEVPTPNFWDNIAQVLKLWFKIK